MTNCLTSRLAKCEVMLDKLHSVFMYLASRVFAYLHEKESNAHSFGNVSVDDCTYRSTAKKADEDEEEKEKKKKLKKKEKQGTSTIKDKGDGIREAEAGRTVRRKGKYNEKIFIVGTTVRKIRKSADSARP